MSASNLLLHAFTYDDFSPGGDEQRLIGLSNRMRLFAPANVVSGAESVLRAIVEIALKPSVELRQLAKDALSRSPVPDPILAFIETAGLIWTVWGEARRRALSVEKQFISASRRRDVGIGKYYLAVDSLGA